MITKDYEQYMEFMSQEDFFCDKLVNLQNPYFYIPMNLKQNQEKVNENIKKNKIEQDVFNLFILMKFCFRIFLIKCVINLEIHLIEV